jgi:hypothetical protein
VSSNQSLQQTKPPVTPPACAGAAPDVFAAEAGVSHEGAGLLKIAAALGLALLVAMPALAAIEQAPNDRWMTNEHSIVIEGRVVSIVLVGPRVVSDLPFAGTEHWQFLHARARFAVYRVLQNRTDIRLAAGDTVSALFVADHTSVADGEGYVHIVNDHFPDNRLLVGVRGAYFLHMSDGEMWCLPSMWDSPRVLDAIKKYGDNRVGTEGVERAR